MAEKKEEKSLIGFDREFLAKGYRLVAGADEAGRGPLAGPIVCACVIMPLDDEIKGIDDSKKLSEAKRDILYPLIIKKATAYSVSIIDSKTIDEINIHNANKLGIKNAIEGLAVKPDIALIDFIKDLGLDIESHSFVKGDGLSYNIAAASIVAKVTRDNIMRGYHKLFPSYSFDKHKGYATAAHYKLLEQYGACEIHRKTFL